MKARESLELKLEEIKEEVILKVGWNSMIKRKLNTSLLPLTIKRSV